MVAFLLTLFNPAGLVIYPKLTSEGYLCGMRVWWVSFFLLLSMTLFSQQGIIRGTVSDETNKVLEGASVELVSLKDSIPAATTATNKDGSFSISAILVGYYRLTVSFVGLQVLHIDSIHFRAERLEFNLDNLVLKARANTSLNEIVIYAEKPLIQSKDGNITFNAGESALSQGSNASDLLTQVPLVTKDPDGKVLVRGKEPRILIDDKPVELNLQQLQDLLESLPGSAIEKIEVMTNPPPQYANEQGGVINIVTKKGTTGINGRVSLFAGTRGETGANASFSYRRTGLSATVNAGTVNNIFMGNGYSIRENIFKDSTNFFNTRNNYQNQAYRPNFRANVDYEITRSHLLNAVLQFNQNNFDNNSTNFYQNINRFQQPFRASERNVNSNGYSLNPNGSLNYTFKAKRPGEQLRLFTSFWLSDNFSDRLFYQQFFNPDLSFSGNDSTQVQVNQTLSKGYNIRLSYERPLANNKTFLSGGGYFNHTASDVEVDALYKQKSDNEMLPLDLLSNYFLFYQDVSNLRLSVKQVLGKNFSTTVGSSAEQTRIHFDLLKAGNDTSNAYWTILPFFNLNKTWANNINLTVSYRKSIRRPGINELNPTRDFADPYNIRAGNPMLVAATTHNFDLVLGRTKNALYTNIGLGYNLVNDIFNPIRKLLADGNTEIIWQNISGKKEYEISTWSGYTFARKLRVNLNASYIYNQYGAYDKAFRRFRDAGSFTSNINTNYVFRELYTATGNFTFNRFANPQGTVRSNVSMNLGLGAKLFQKKMTITLNMIDPFLQQQNRTFTYGPDFNLENFNTTRTKNYRVSIGYFFSKTNSNLRPSKISAIQKSR